MKQPSYYAIIPASVRYDDELPAGAKLMYGEITALSNAKGYCFASNGYFAKLYNCTPQAISKWVKKLEARGYVKIEYVGEAGEQERRVSLLADYQPQLIGVSTPVEGVSTPVEYNNIKDNNTREIKEIVEFLNSTTSSNYRPTTKATKKHISARLNEGFTVDDFRVVIRHKNKEWSNDEQMRQYLRPQTLFGTKFESYLQAAQRRPADRIPLRQTSAPIERVSAEEAAKIRQKIKSA